MSSIDLGLLVLRLSLGTFFIVSGYRKGFVPGTIVKVQGVFRKYGVPKPAGYAVVFGQLLGGIAVFSGFLTQLAGLLLVPIMAGAFYLSCIPASKAKEPKGWTDWTYTLTCTAEFQLMVGVAVLALTGAGKYSLDRLLFGL